MAVVIAGFVLLSGVEVASLHFTSQSISFLNTISLIMLSFLLGVIAGRSYSQDWIEKIQWHLRSRKVAPDEVINGAVMVVCSWLLITPGVVTDILGFIILVPKTRFIARGIARTLMEKKIAAGQDYFFIKD